jgi:mannose-6-phosphate isomerase-like protein (cupin superfamily)
MDEKAREAAAATGVKAREVLFLPAGAGRTYEVGPMHAVFKADGVETDDRYCVSEWWLEAGQPGPGPHAHEANEELFYVLEGTMTFLAGEEWVDAPRGSFLRVPAGTTHDFENQSDARAGVLNVFLPGGFETIMPRLVAWAAEQAGGEASAATRPSSRPG